VLGDRSAKRSAPNHNHIEWPPAAIFPGVDLGKIIAEIPTLNVARECSPFSCEWHCDGVWWVVSFEFVEPKLEARTGEAWKAPSVLFLILL
jgi:hypothetical protein